MTKSLDKIGRSKNLTNQKFGRLTVISPIFKNEDRKNYGVQKWICKCECGNECLSFTTNLINGQKLSCGCLKREISGHINIKYKPEEAAFRAKASNYKANAKGRNLTWELSIEETINFLKGNCHYCNSPPENTYTLTRNRGKSKSIYYNYDVIKYNGIDRTNNKKGYTTDNCVSCCKRCNQAKMDSDYYDFINWINSLIKFRTNS